MILADFHIHSTFSDGKMTVPELIDFYGSRGFGCIAITDHICEERSFMGVAASYLNYTLSPATWPLYIEILRSEAERAWDRYKMVVIAGYELSKNSWSNHRSAHILGIGVNEFVGADGDVVDLARKIRAQGALAIAAHPVSTRKVERQTYHLWHRRKEMAQELDAWEVASGAHLFDEVKESGLPMIASSDLHYAAQINSWKTVVHSERHPEAILDAIRKQNVSFQFYKEVAAESQSHGVYASSPWSRFGQSGIGRLARGFRAAPVGNLAHAAPFAPPRSS